MLRKNKVFFILSLLFLILALICTVFVLIAGAELTRLGQTSGDAEKAIGAAAAGVVMAFFLVLFSIATWGFSALTLLFCVLNLRAALRWLRITSAAFLGSAILLSLTAALSLLLRAG